VNPLGVSAALFIAGYQPGYEPSVYVPSKPKPEAVSRGPGWGKPWRDVVSSERIDAVSRRYTLACGHVRVYHAFSKKRLVCLECT
jgi:hypothetical protein